MFLQSRSTIGPASSTPYLGRYRRKTGSDLTTIPKRYSANSAKLSEFVSSIISICDPTFLQLRPSPDWNMIGATSFLRQDDPWVNPPATRNVPARSDPEGGCDLHRGSFGPPREFLIVDVPAPEDPRPYLQHIGPINDFRLPRRGHSKSFSAFGKTVRHQQILSFSSFTVTLSNNRKRLVSDRGSPIMFPRFAKSDPRTPFSKPRTV